MDFRSFYDWKESSTDAFHRSLSRLELIQKLFLAQLEELTSEK